MDLNLSEIFARFQEESHEEVLSIFDEQIILSIEEIPDYLQHGNDTKGIIAQKFLEKNTNRKKSEDSVLLKSTSTPVKSLSSQSSYEHSDLDITGSPLKCPFVANEEGTKFSPYSFSCSQLRKKANNQSPSYAGFTVSKARYLATKFQYALRSAAKEDLFILPVWIACNGDDALKTRFIGVHFQENIFTMSDVTSSGPCESFDHLPSVDHLTSYFCFGNPSKRTDASCVALYEVLSSDEANGSSIFLSSTWKHPLSTLSPPTIDAKTCTKIHIEPSDPRSDAHQVYLELNFLESLINSLESGEVTWFLRTDETQVLHKLDDYFAAQKQKKINENYMASFDNIIEEKFLQVRPNMGFTDYIWSMLMKCQSYDELQSCLLHVFENISTGVIRPQIHVRNKTQVAETCRKLMRGQEAIPEFKGLLALEMMVEIGLEKIKRDYISIFEVGELVKIEQLLQFTNWNSTSDPFENCLKKLQQIHVALQVIIALRRYLHLPSPVLAQCTSQVLTELNGKMELQLDFDFNFPTTLIHTIFNSVTVLLWKLNISSNSEGGSNYSKSCDYYIRRDHDFFPPAFNAVTDNDSTLDDSDTMTFFSLAVTKISNKLLQ